MDVVTVGRVRTSHGVRGALKVSSTSGEYEHFKKMDRVQLSRANPVTGGSAAWFEVEDVRGSGSNLILKLVGIDSPEQAAAWRGAEVRAERRFAAPCAENEFYITDLVGCTVLLDGTAVGTVNAVWDSGAADMFEVSTERGIRNVPFRTEFIGAVDTSEQTIELLVDWIIE